ncbi:hypothetical protein [Blastococcus sp. SYSU D00695]
MDVAQTTTAGNGLPAYKQPVEWDGVLARVRGSSLARRLVPYPVALFMIRTATRLKFRLRPDRLAAARATMDAIVGNTPLESRLDELAARHVAARAETIEYSWRMWLVRREPVEGVENLQRRAPGQGVVVSTTHFGPLFAGRNIGAHVDRSAYVSVAGDWAYTELPKGYLGYWFRYTKRPDPLWPRSLLASGSRARLEQVLRDGGTVSIAMDLPGSQETRFLGKTVYMASGTARLAAATGSLVVPSFPTPVGRGRWRTVLGEPLDPADHASWQDLHQALADRHTAHILTAPEYLEDPVRGGAWAQADRDVWPNPRG